MSDGPKKPNPWPAMAIAFAATFLITLLFGTSTRVASIDSDTTSIRFKLVQMQLQLDRIERELGNPTR